MRPAPTKCERASGALHAAARRENLSRDDRKRTAMILLTHPFGNANVRAVLDALDHHALLAQFVTALGWSNSSPLLHVLPANLRAQLERRGYDLPHYKIKTHPGREIVRLLAERFQQRWLLRHETGFASVDRVWCGVDEFAAEYLEREHTLLKVRTVYAYEDCAMRLFETAHQFGIRCVYD